MALKLKTMREVSKETAYRYQKARKEEKTKILDEFVALTGHTRHHAAWVLRTWEKRRSRAGPALVNRIPVKTFSQWDRTRPGDVQVDLVVQSRPLERFMRS